MNELKTSENTNTNISAPKKNHAAVFIYLLFFVLLVFTISQKCYYHPNEYCMYILANKYVQAVPTPSGDSGYIFKTDFSNAGTIKACMAVEPGHAFDFANVWHNMAYNESHPPISGLLLHFVASFFPGVASKWFGGAINILFLLLTLFIVRKFVRIFTDDEFILTAISLVIACSSALCNAAAFFRMYVIAMLWFTLNTYLFVRQAGKPATKKFCMQAFAVTLFSTMTHYYCAFYAILLSCIYAVQLLRDCEYKGLLKFSFAQLLSGTLFLIIYPRALQHLFFDSRGAESITNAGSMSDFSARLVRCSKIMNNELFGGMLVVFLLLSLGLCIYEYKFKSRSGSLNRENASKLAARRYCFVFIPIICYFLVVSKTAHIQVVDFFQEGFSRYFHPIFAVSLAGVLTYVFTRLSEIMKPKFSKIAITILSVLVICGSFLCTNWDMDFVYRGFMQNQPIRDAYADADCICFTAIGINFCEECEFAGYKSLTWLPLNFDYTKLDNVNFGSKLVVCIQNPGYNTDETMNRILPHLRGFNVTYRVPLFLYWGAKGTLYYLDRVVN